MNPSPVPSQAELLRVTFGCMVLSVVGLIFSIAVSSIAMTVGIVCAVVMLARGGSIRGARTPLDLFILFYAGAELLASIFSVEPAHSFFNMKRLLLITVMYLAWITVVDRKRVGIAVGSFIAFGSVFCIVEILSSFPSDGRFTRVSLFQYYLTSGGIKMFILLLALPFVVHPRTPSRVRIWAIAACVPTVLALLLTQTRSAWLGFIGGTLIIGIVRSRWLLAALVLLMVLFVLFAPADFRERAASIFDPSMTSNLTRIHMIQTGWRMFLDYPIVGTGDIDLKRLYLTYTVPIDDAEGGHLHNNAMMLLVTLGAVGFAASLALFIAIGVLEMRAVRLARDEWLAGSVTLGTLAAYTGFHIMGLFEWNFGDHEIAVLLWFTLGVSLAMVRQHVAAGDGGRDGL